MVVVLLLLTGPWELLLIVVVLLAGIPVTVAGGPGTTAAGGRDSDSKSINKSTCRMLKIYIGSVMSVTTTFENIIAY